MFYCEPCRVIFHYPRALGWPHQDVSHGMCELCHRVDYCHDQRIPRIADVSAELGPMVLNDCSECEQNEWHAEDDYICFWCRTGKPKPSGRNEIHQANEKIDRLIRKMVKDGTEGRPWKADEITKIISNWQ